jgi:Xaa-Pro aminopeptidase
MLGFEVLTLAPIDTRPVDPALLDAGEKAWLNAYHARLRKALGPMLDAGERAWLKNATNPI